MDFDLSDDSMDIAICVNFGVFDIYRGLLLKIGENKEILAAMKGRRVLEPEEIRGLYGGPVPKFDALNWPYNHNSNYWTFSAYFDHFKAATVAMCVEAIDAGKVDKTY